MPTSIFLLEALFLMESEVMASAVFSGYHQWAVAQSWCGSADTKPHCLSFSSCCHFSFFFCLYKPWYCSSLLFLHRVPCLSSLARTRSCLFQPVRCSAKVTNSISLTDPLPRFHIFNSTYLHTQGDSLNRCAQTDYVKEISIQTIVWTIFFFFSHKSLVITPKAFVVKHKSSIPHHADTVRR